MASGAESDRSDRTVGSESELGLCCQQAWVRVPGLPLSQVVLALTAFLSALILASESRSRDTNHNSQGNCEDRCIQKCVFPSTACHIASAHLMFLVAGSHQH